MALKYLRDSSNDIERESFRREARQAASLIHDNVVRLVAVCFDSDHALIAIELMPNGDLRAYLKFCAESHYGKVRTAQLMKLSIDVAKGVEYLHRANLVHRDLALRNVLLDHTFVAKVTDFGSKFE